MQWGVHGSEEVRRKRLSLWSCCCHQQKRRSDQQETELLHGSHPVATHRNINYISSILTLFLNQIRQRLRYVTTIPFASGAVALWQGNSPPPKFCVGKLSENLLLVRKTFRKQSRGKIEILSTRNLCRKFAVFCRKIGTLCPGYFFHPRRRCRSQYHVLMNTIQVRHIPLYSNVILTTATEGAEVTCSGRLFQTRAAATGKARAPTV